MLAELIVARLIPALPDGVVARPATEADIGDLRRVRARTPDPGFPTPPEYGLVNGVLVVHAQPPPARRIIAITYGDQRILTEEHLAIAVNEALQAVTDEASEASADRYESDASVENGRLRIWFGVVPSGRSPGRWRDIVAELDSIPLSQIAVS
jgi:hypothetical protein